MESTSPVLKSKRTQRNNNFSSQECPMMWYECFLFHLYMCKEDLELSNKNSKYSVTFWLYAKMFIEFPNMKQYLFFDLVFLQILFIEGHKNKQIVMTFSWWTPWWKVMVDTFMQTWGVHFYANLWWTFHLCKFKVDTLMEMYGGHCYANLGLTHSCNMMVDIFMQT